MIGGGGTENGDSRGGVEGWACCVLDSHPNPLPLLTWPGSVLVFEWCAQFFASGCIKPPLVYYIVGPLFPHLENRDKDLPYSQALKDTVVCLSYQSGQPEEPPALRTCLSGFLTKVAPPGF